TVEPRGGKLQDIDVISLENDLLARTAVDEHRRYRLTAASIPLAVNFLLIALHRQGVTLARGQGIDENRNILAAGVLEQKRRAAASQARDTDCAQLLIQVDRHAHAGKLAFSVEQINKFSQTGKSHETLLMRKSPLAPLFQRGELVRRSSVSERTRSQTSPFEKGGQRGI